MIKASELRIGNILQKHDGTIFTVTSKFIVEYDGHEDEMLMSNPPKPFYDGVLLTEEWLLKFGT